MSDNDRIALAFAGGCLGSIAVACDGCNPPAICVAFLISYFVCGLITMRG